MSRSARRSQSRRPHEGPGPLGHDLHTGLQYQPALPIPNGKTCLWLFLSTEIMFFAGLIGAYIVLRFGAAAWPATHDVHLVEYLGAINTAVLIASSITVVLALEAAKRDNAIGRQGLDPAVARAWARVSRREGVRVHGKVLARHLPCAAAQPNLRKARRVLRPGRAPAAGRDSRSQSYLSGRRRSRNFKPRAPATTTRELPSSTRRSMLTTTSAASSRSPKWPSPTSPSTLAGRQLLLELADKIYPRASVHHGEHAAEQHEAEATAEIRSEDATADAACRCVRGSRSPPSRPRPQRRPPAPKREPRRRVGPPPVTVTSKAISTTRYPLAEAADHDSRRQHVGQHLLPGHRLPRHPRGRGPDLLCVSAARSRSA